MKLWLNSLILGLGLSSFGAVRTPIYVDRTNLNTRVAVDGEVVEIAGYGGNKWKFVSGSANTNLPNITTAAGAWELQNWNGDAKAFGVKGDGVTDDTVAMQGWLDRLQSGVKGFLPKGTYVISTNLTFTNSIWIDGEVGAVIENRSHSVGAIASAVTAPTEQNILTGDVEEGTEVLPVTTTSGLSQGDWIVIGDDSLRENGVFSGNAINIEINKINSLTASNITLEYATISRYATANTNWIARLSNELRVDINGVEINVPTGYNGGGLYLRYVTGGHITRYKCTGMYWPGIWVETSSRVMIDNSDFQNGQSITVGGLGYGIRISGGSHHCSASFITSGKIREHVFGGGARFCKFTDSVMMNHHDDGVNTHGQGCRDIDLSRNIISYCGGYGILASWNTASAGDYRILIQDNHIYGTGSGILCAFPTNTSPLNSDIVIDGNFIHAGTNQYAIRIDRAAYGMKVTDNYCLGDSGSYGISLSAGSGAVVENNTLVRFKKRPILVTDETIGNIFRNNHVYEPNDIDGLYISNGRNFWDGNSLYGGTGNQYGLRISAPSNVVRNFYGAEKGGPSAIIVEATAVGTVIEGGELVGKTNLNIPIRLQAANTILKDFTLSMTDETNDAIVYITGTNVTVDNIRIQNCSNTPNAVVIAATASGATVKNSRFENGITGRMVSVLAGADNITVERNIFRNSAGSYAVRFDGNSAIRVIGNQFEDTASYAVSSSAVVTNGLVQFNWFIDDNTRDPAINFASGSSVRVVGNTYGQNQYDNNPAQVSFRNDGDVTLNAGHDAPVQIYSGTLAGNRIATLNATTAHRGDQFILSKQGTTAYSLGISNNAASPSLLTTLGVGTNNAAATVVYDGSNWRIINLSVW